MLSVREPNLMSGVNRALEKVPTLCSPTSTIMDVGAVTIQRNEIGSNGVSRRQGIEIAR